LTDLVGYVTFSSGSILLKKSHLLRDFSGISFAIVRHADIRQRSDFMTFFAFADRTASGIIE
jgi:hypothetical protein